MLINIFMRSLQLNNFYFSRIFELLWLMLATFAALIFFQSAKESDAENDRLKAELRRARKSSVDLNKNESSRGQCSVCLAEIAEVIIQPCGHVCICRDCADTIMENVDRKCPICRGRMKKIQNVYLS